MTDPIDTTPSFTDPTSAPAPSFVPAATVGTPKTPGEFSADISSPGALSQSVGEAAQQGGSLLSGLFQTVFGTSQPNAQGEHGGILGGIPIASDLGRFAGEAAANVIGGVAGAAGAVAENLPNPIDPVAGGQIGAEFAALPDSPEKTAILQQMAKSPFGFGNTNAEYQYVQEQKAQALGADKGTSLATLYPEWASGVAPTLAGFVNQLLSMPFQRPVERTIAGLNLGNGDRLDQSIAATKAGTANEAEAMAAEKFQSGEWTRDHALDFLSASHAGISGNPLVELVGSALTDPTTLVSLGAGLASKAVDVAALSGRATEAGMDAADVFGSGIRAAAKRAMVPLGNALTPVEASHIGQIASVAKGVMDPLGTVLGHLPSAKAAQDMALMSVRSTSGYIHAIGLPNYTSLLDRVAAFGRSEGANADLAALIDHGLGVGVGNMTNEMMGRTAAEQFSSLLGKVDNRAPQLFGDATTPAEYVGQMTAPKDFDVLVAEEANRTKKLFGFDRAEETQTLASRLSDMWSIPAENIQNGLLSHLNDDQLAALHMASYGAKDAQWIDARQGLITSIGNKVVGRGPNGAPLSRLILMNQTTLTQEAVGGLAAAMKKAKSFTDKVAVLDKAMDSYGSIARLIRIPANGEITPGTISYFNKVLARLREEATLPHELRSEEYGNLPDELKNLVPQGGSWKVGFSPEDTSRWGMQEASDGRTIIMDPYIEHASTEAASYRPSMIADLTRNIAGTPIGRGVQVASRPLSWLETGLKTMGSDVSTRMIALDARNRFYTLAGDAGISPEIAQRAWSHLAEMVDTKEAPSMMALTTRNMWEAVKEDLGPMRGRFEASDFALMVARANEGNLRNIGLAQKLTGMMKSTALRLPGGKGNFLGNMSGEMWQKLHFLFNLTYKAWTGVEPYVFSAMRGFSPVGRLGNLSDEDLATLNLARKMADTGMFSMARKAEFASGESFATYGRTGRDLQAALQGLGTTRLEELQGRDSARMVTMLRGWKQELGQIYNKVYPKEYMQTLADHYQSYSDVALTDADLAVRDLSEKMGLNSNIFANDGGDALDYSAVRNEAQWKKPDSTAEVRPLNLDDMAHYVYKTETVKTLRNALMTGTRTADSISQDLLDQGFHPDVVNRAVHALQFNTKTFFRELKAAFSLDPNQYQDTVNYLQGMARAKGMTTDEFLSQYFGPRVSRYSKQDILNASAVKRAIAAGKPPPPLQRVLAKNLVKHVKDQVTILGVDGRGSYGDMMRSLSRVFSFSLDDSGKAAVMRALDGLPAGTAVDVAKWGPKYEQGLADLMRGYAHGIEPSNPNVTRILQAFGKFTDSTKAAKFAVSDEAKSAVGDVLGVPRQAAMFADHTEALAFNSLMQQITNAESDMFRLFYYARTQKQVLRSLNHPFLGLYPASYMWGKMAPELFRFIAKEPFGIRTSALAYGLHDMQQTLAVQMETDPSFNAFFHGAGADPMLNLLFFLLPASPFDMPTSAPGWMRALAAYGNSIEPAIQAGKPIPALNIKSIAEAVINYMNSPQKTLNEAAGVVKEGQDIFQGQPNLRTTKGKQEVLPGVIHSLASGPVDALSELHDKLFGASPQPTAESQPSPGSFSGTLSGVVPTQNPNNPSGTPFNSGQLQSEMQADYERIMRDVMLGASSAQSTQQGSG